MWTVSECKTAVKPREVPIRLCIIWNFSYTNEILHVSSTDSNSPYPQKKRRRPNPVPLLSVEKNRFAFFIDWHLNSTLITLHPFESISDRLRPRSEWKQLNVALAPAVKCETNEGFDIFGTLPRILFILKNYPFCSLRWCDLRMTDRQTVHYSPLWKSAWTTVHTQKREGIIKLCRFVII